MGLSIRFTGDGPADEFSLASAGGWAAFAAWAARLAGASAVKRLASGGRVTGTDALAKQLAAALRVSPPPKPVASTARDLLANLGVSDKGETAAVVNEAEGGGGRAAAFAEWNPADHPRGTHGRFAAAGRAVAAAHPHPGEAPDRPAGSSNPHMLAADPALRAAVLLHEAWARRMNAHIGGQILKRMTERPPALRPPEPDAPPARQAALLRRAKEIHDTAESDVLRLGPAFAPAAEHVAAAHPEGRELLAFARDEADRRLTDARASFADHVAAVAAQPRRTAVSIFRKAGVTRSDILNVSGRAFPAAPRPGGVE